MFVSTVTREVGSRNTSGTPYRLAAITLIASLFILFLYTVWFAAIKWRATDPVLLGVIGGMAAVCLNSLRSLRIAFRQKAGS